LQLLEPLFQILKAGLYVVIIFQVCVTRDHGASFRVTAALHSQPRASAKSSVVLINLGLDFNDACFYHVYFVDKVLITRLREGKGMLFNGIESLSQSPQLRAMTRQEFSNGTETNAHFSQIGWLLGEE
jgi:hypothetical protein